MKSAVSVVKCNSYTPYLVDGAVRKCVDLLGGITSFIKPKSKVLVKPNLLMAKEPEFGITTHPEVLCAVIKILKEINSRVAPEAPAKQNDKNFFFRPIFNKQQGSY